MFFDHAKIHVAAGKGGDGGLSFRREKHVPKGGPDGGDGGHGGDVVLRADPQLRDLQPFTYKVHFKAGAGQPGGGARKHGADGETVVIPVPLGTQVWAVAEPEDTGEDVPLADMVRPGQEQVVAGGGAGGRGNTRFKNSVRQAPRFAELGEQGESRWLRLSLKLVADAGLAGLPNAGKSSLLRRVSNARPKVAAYPFTTLEPMLGVVDWTGDGDTFTLADVPGLLEGASEGIGLGHEFLAHLERCFLLVHVVDVSGQEGGLSPVEAFRVILKELEAHAAELAHKPQVVVLNKIDTLEAAEVDALRGTFVAEVEALRRSGHPAFAYLLGDGALPAQQLVWPVSAVTGAGLADLVRRLGILLRELRAPVDVGMTEVPRPAEVIRRPAVAAGGVADDDAPAEGHAIFRPAPTGAAAFSVRRERQGFVVEGESVRRLVSRFDLTNEEAIRYLAERLDRLGVYAALRAQGAQPGDEVDLEGYAFEFH